MWIWQHSLSWGLSGGKGLTIGGKGSLTGDMRKPKKDTWLGIDSGVIQQEKK